MRRQYRGSIVTTVSDKDVSLHIDEDDGAFPGTVVSFQKPGAPGAIDNLDLSRNQQDALVVTTKALACRLLNENDHSLMRCYKGDLEGTAEFIREGGLVPTRMLSSGNERLS